MFALTISYRSSPEPSPESQRWWYIEISGSAESEHPVTLVERASMLNVLVFFNYYHGLT